MYKAGYKTSEFWFTMVSFIFSGLYLVGLINDNGQKEDLIRDVSHGVESIILIGGQLVILWKYIKSRTAIKEAYWNNSNNVPINTNTESVDNDKSGTNKKRSRSTNRSNKTKSSRSKKNSNS